MSVLSLILGDRRFRTEIGVLTLDAAVSVQHSANATPTKNPIEARSGDPIDNFTDHIRLENRSLNIEGIISESPLSELGSAFNVFTGAVSGAVGTAVQGPLAGLASQAFATGLGSVAGLIANRREGDLSFAQKAFDYLIELRDNRQPFIVCTSLKLYLDMVLTSLSVPVTAADGKSLRFSASFEQIEIVQTETVKLPEAITKNPSAAAKQNRGKQADKEATESTGSVLKNFSNDRGWTTRGSGVVQ